jgi:cytochrome c
MQNENNLFCALVTAFTIATVLGAMAPPARAADATRGETVFKSCAACHTGRPDALGPNLKGVYGRKAGALEDFRYSPAMKRTDFVWDEANLKAYINDPQGKVKGNRMPFSGLKSQADVDDVIAYLQRLK